MYRVAIPNADWSLRKCTSYTSAFSSNAALLAAPRVEGLQARRYTTRGRRAQSIYPAISWGCAVEEAPSRVS